MKHTPGPWKIDENKAYPVGVIQDDEMGLGIAEIGEWNSRNIANARLIAAAPDLLEACKLAFERLTPKGGVKKDYAGHVAWAGLSAAIFKAERG